MSITFNVSTLFISKFNNISKKYSVAFFIQDKELLKSWLFKKTSERVEVLAEEQVSGQIILILFLYCYFGFFYICIFLGLTFIGKIL